MEAKGRAASKQNGRGAAEGAREETTEANVRRYLSSLRAVAAAGALVGMVLGALGWSQAWPQLSLAAAARATVIAWAIGLAASPLLHKILRRRTTDPVAAGRAWTRAVRVAVTVVAVAPAVLVLTLLQPQGLLRRAVAPVRRPGDERPNLILITIDALRTDYVGAYGSQDGLTPHMDAFAQEATRYDAAYVSSPWTLTSFASIMSSRPPSQCGLKLTTPRMHNWYLYSAKLPDTVPLISEQLQRAGYTTAAELTNCFLTDERGWHRGFSYFRNEDGPGLGAILTRADTVTRNTLAWLRLRPRQPFFLWVHYLDPHVPYNSPETPPELRAQYPGDWLTRREYWYATMRYQDEATKVRYGEFCRKMYAEEVRYTDRWLGELLRAIREVGEWDRSLIVISSDHGEELFDHGEFEHGHSLHEELLRVPLLVKWPRGVAAESRIQQVVSMTGLPMTFVELAGAPHLDGAVGQPLPRQSGEGGEEVYSEGVLHGPEQTALTTDRYKAIHRPATQLAGDTYLLYDRSSDRQERVALASSEPASALRERLLSQEKAAQAAARKWKVSNQQEFRGIDLSHATREKLKALGYIGD